MTRTNAGHKISTTKLQDSTGFVSGEAWLFPRSRSKVLWTPPISTTSVALSRSALSSTRRDTRREKRSKAVFLWVFCQSSARSQVIERPWQRASVDCLLVPKNQPISRTQSYQFDGNLSVSPKPKSNIGHSKNMFLPLQTTCFFRFISGHQVQKRGAKNVSPSVSGSTTTATVGTWRPRSPPSPPPWR